MASRIDSQIAIRPPKMADGPRIHALVTECPPLDVNSVYSYLLLATHFSDTCTVAEADGRLLGFQTGYRKPRDQSVLFIWQVAVAAEGRGAGIAKRMIMDLLGRFEPGVIRYLEQTVSPSNAPSRALFTAIARELGTELTETALFEEGLFHDQHEAERLLRVGPLPTGSVPAGSGSTPSPENKIQGVT